MPYKRKRSSYGAYTSNKRIHRPSPFASAESAAKQLRMARMNLRTGGYLGRENKFYDTSLLGDFFVAPSDAAGGELNPSATVLLNTVAQGVTESQRIGRQIKMQSIQINGMIHMPVQTNPSVLDTHPSVFLAVVLDTQTNGVTINSEDVYKNPSADPSLAAHPFRNLEQVQRFKILKSTQLKLTPVLIGFDGTTMEQSGTQTPFTMYIKLNGLITNFCGTTSDVANIVDNSLHIIGYASNLGYTPSISYNARLRYTG